MEIFFILAIVLMINAMVGLCANNWNRSFWGFFLLGLVVSPILSAAVLLIMGKQKVN